MVLSNLAYIVVGPEKDTWDGAGYPDRAQASKQPTANFVSTKARVIVLVTIKNIDKSSHQAWTD